MSSTSAWTHTPPSFRRRDRQERRCQVAARCNREPDDAPIFRCLPRRLHRSMRGCDFGIHRVLSLRRFWRSALRESGWRLPRHPWATPDPPPRGAAPRARDFAVTPSAATIVAGVAGSPIGHSLSPVLHNTWIKASNLDAIYLAFEPRDFRAFAHGLRGGAMRGLNITAPFKAQALELADSVSRRAVSAGAAN